MSDALPLPPRPHLDYYRALARDLTSGARRGTVHDWATRWTTNLSALMIADPAAPPAGARVPGWPSISDVTNWVERQWTTFVDEHLKKDPASAKLTDAQFFLARLHGFESWPRFAHHLTTMADGDSLTAAFESAADAIVSGDLTRLGVLLDAHPDLVHRRSTRDHHASLLHYVSANGIEDFRQRTPPNIVQIAGLLLDRGADVNAESDAYRGHSTTLGLTATSAHPDQAGVQIALLELLLARGADIEPRKQAGNGQGAVTGCLANGQGRAARFLAARGASLDLEGAAGVNRADIVATYFDADNALTRGATIDELDRAVLYASGYGADEALGVLLAHGANPNRRDRNSRFWAGQTALHWATYGPHVRVAKQLLAAGAKVEARDDRWQATPLEWALHAWVHDWNPEARERGYALIEALIGAGATVSRDSQDEKTQVALQADPRMRSILLSAP